MISKNLSLILPAFNESRVLPRVVSDICIELRKVEPSFEVIVVDNGSIDDTEAVISSMQNNFPEIVLVRVYPNQGFGNGIILGLDKAQGKVVGWAGADGQLIASEIAKVYRTLLEKKVNFAKGERIQSSKDFLRKIQSKSYTIVFQKLFGSFSTDVNGTPKFLRTDLVKQIGLESKDWFIDSECVLKAARLSSIPLEVPVEWKQREVGYSNVNIRAIFQFLKNLFIYKFGKRY